MLATERWPQRGDLGQAPDRFEELFALAQLRSNPATRRLNDRRIGLIAPLLLAVLAHRMRMHRLPAIRQ